MDRRDDACSASPVERSEDHLGHTPSPPGSSTASIGPETYREIFASAFSCVVEYEHDAAWVEVSGDLDVSTAAKLGEALDAALSQARLVVVDMSRLAFIDCTGIGALVAVHDRARRSQGELVISSVSTQVSRLLDITGTFARFGITRRSIGQDGADRTDAGQSDRDSGGSLGPELVHDGPTAHPPSATQAQLSTLSLGPVGAPST